MSLHRWAYRSRNAPVTGASAISLYIRVRTQEDDMYIGGGLVAVIVVIALFILIF